jgi:AraC family transcriptional activator of pyochelin receptor
MAFTMTDVPAGQLADANDFFQKGFDGDMLVERLVEINNTLVNGHSQEWYFDGIRMAYSDLRFARPEPLKWDYHIDIDLITFQINIDGTILMETRDGATVPFINSRQHNLFYSPGNDGDGGYLKSERLRSSMFFMQFTKEAFLRLTADANEALTRFNESVMGNMPAMLSANNLPVGGAMLSTVKSIINCPFEKDLKKMYLHSKAIEFLVLQAEACNKEVNMPVKYITSPYEKECMVQARDYLTANMDNPPSLSALAKICGVNEYKLKRGFKETFGTTVFGYLSDARLELAKEDIVHNRKSSAEIATELGYSSPQHFSNAFKKKFGLSPNQFRK